MDESVRGWITIWPSHDIKDTRTLVSICNEALLRCNIFRQRTEHELRLTTDGCSKFNVHAHCRTLIGNTETWPRTLSMLSREELVRFMTLPYVLSHMKTSYGRSSDVCVRRKAMVSAKRDWRGPWASCSLVNLNPSVKCCSLLRIVRYLVWPTVEDRACHCT